MTTSRKSFKDVFDKYKYDRTAVTKSRSWFQGQIALLRNEKVTPAQLLRADKTALRPRVLPGFLYMFVYDPKTKATLPYYDAFPLVFPFAKTQNGFLGLNMHYLPYPLRIMLLDRLMLYANNKNLDEVTRLKLSWELLANTSRLALAQPCVKEYLVDHVRSQFRKIEADDWMTAMMLPVEQFKKATSTKVWADSRKKLTK
jgi:hypothetical protein